MRNSKAFTIIELMVATFIIVVGLGGAMNLILQIFSNFQIPKAKLVATYLVQEGIEIVRNIRDTNWIENSPNWDDGIQEGNFIADYDNNQQLDPFEDKFLNLDSAGFYSYYSGTQTKFKRIIIIDKIPDTNPDKISVLVNVEWQEKGRDYQVFAKEELYKWR